MIDSYDRLPVGKYMQILAALDRTDNEEIDRQLEVISILSGISVDDIGMMELSAYRELSSRAAFLGEEYAPEMELPSTIKAGRFELEYIKDYAKLTVSQYVDFQTFCKDGRHKIVEMLSCLLVPKGHKYNQDYDVLEVQSALRETLMTSEAVALAAFFLKLYVDSIGNTLASLESEAKKESDPKMKASILREISRIKEEFLATIGDGSPA